MTQLRFADISSHNAVSNWGTFLGSLDGLVMKISEGIGYTWSGAPNALAQARNAGKLVGAYHFARVNDPVQEADYFLAHYTHQPGEVIVLDWEPGTTVGDGDAWAYAWCSRVIAATGVVPWLYLNHYYASVQSQWVRTRSLGCGLWAAWYGANTGQPLSGMPSFAPWPSVAAWQYTSAGSAPGHSGSLDLNYFYGDATAWRAYGNPGTPQEADMTPEEHEWLRQLWAVFSRAYDPATGADAGTRLVRIDQSLTALTPQAIAAAIGQLPAQQAQQVAQLVLAGLNGAQLSVTSAQPPAAS